MSQRWRSSVMEAKSSGDSFPWTHFFHRPESMTSCLRMEVIWECIATLNEGQIKFKGNGTWDNQDGNWGGSLQNVVNGSNDNIDVPVIGKVQIKFFPRCDTKSYATITAVD